MLLSVVENRRQHGKFSVKIQAVNQKNLTRATTVIVKSEQNIHKLDKFIPYSVVNITRRCLNFMRNVIQI